jgi:hypothetical protein
VSSQDTPIYIILYLYHPSNILFFYPNLRFAIYISNVAIVTSKCSFILAIRYILHINNKIMETICYGLIPLDHYHFDGSKRKLAKNTRTSILVNVWVTMVNKKDDIRDE